MTMNIRIEIHTYIKERPLNVIQFMLICLIICLFPVKVRAQMSFDVPSVEAYIKDHKTQRSLLIARAALEESNKLLHSYSEEKVTDYKEINKQLDKYTRAFDIIDMLYQSLRTALNTYSTIETITTRVTDYKDLLETYNSKCLSRGNIDVADLQIIAINGRMLERISEDSQQLYKSVNDLILYATGVASCTTSDLLLILENINKNLDLIRQHINKAYFDTWRFIQIRIGYWKSRIYRAKTKREIIDGAFGRWKEASDGMNRE